MCMRIKTGPHKARSDKKVFKVLEVSDATGKLVSPYQETPYRLGRTMKSPIVARPGCGGLQPGGGIDQGLHACTTLTATESHRFDSCDWRVFRARIPAGATYYIGENGDIVSDQLVVDKATPVLVRPDPFDEED